MHSMMITPKRPAVAAASGRAPRPLAPRPAVVTAPRLRGTTICRRAGSIEQAVHLVTKSTLLFVFFTSALNYLHYRQIRKDIEKNEE